MYHTWSYSVKHLDESLENILGEETTGLGKATQIIASISGVASVAHLLLSRSHNLSLLCFAFEELLPSHLKLHLPIISQVCFADLNLVYEENKQE